MKKIIRLTESDLTRIVRRIVLETTQSTPNVDPKKLTYGFLDNKGTNLVTSKYVNTGKYNGIDEVQLSMTKTTFEPNENVKLVIGGGFVASEASIYVATTKSYAPVTVSNQGGTATIEFNMSMIGDNTLSNEVMSIKGNVNNGSLRIMLLFKGSTIQQIKESYRRRY